jgi:TPR repeat protein
MQRKCPQCGGLNVRRSSIRAPEESAQHTFLSPYRCRDCRERFWVVSRNAYYLATIVGVALVVGALAGHVALTPDKRASAPEQTAQYAERFTDLAKLADKSDPAAEYELAMMYMNASGVPKNEIEARKWLERSAGHGNAAAQYELGLALRDGRGAIQDFPGAMKWINLAAEAGYGRAQFALGVMYRLGTGTPVDEVKAYTWLNLAAAQGVDGAAAVRDAARTKLSPAEIALAQSEARRLSVQRPGAPDTGPEAEVR